ncbi:MAG: hypothetical protein Q9218_006225 [Villophora microphyllina]
MQPKKPLLIVAAAAMVPRQANGEFDENLWRHAGDNETLYGPMKVIHVRDIDTKFKPYPDIDPKIRDTLDNGGLNHICSSCNQTGCLCPDLGGPLFAPFAPVYENCQGTNGGGLRCYCSSALDARPCNGIDGYTTGCSNPALCTAKSAQGFFCEPQRWDQDPRLANMTAAAVFYDYRTITIGAGANIIAVAQAVAQRGHEGYEGTTYPMAASSTPTATAMPQMSENGKASNKAVGAGGAAIAAAVGAASLMGPWMDGRSGQVFFVCM